MKLWYVCGLVFTCLSLGESYSKYGRTCKDIGCLSNEVCVMETDPCSYYQRQNECGSYPTCKRNQNSGPKTCKNYVCPPTKVCRMDGETPKCVDDHSKVDRVGYATSELKNPNDQPGGSNLYPNLPSGQTTERPNIGYQGPGGSGYQGGQIGTGYPGQPAQPGQPRQNYPQQYPQRPYPQQGNTGYNQPGYGQPGYNQPGYNQQGGYQGYPNQNSYPNYNTNNNQRYPNNNQGGYNPYGQSGYGQQQNTASGGIVDSLTNALKKYGTNLLKTAIANKIAGNNNH